MDERPRLFVLCGPPFAGKSTLARAMEARLGADRIEIDAYISGKAAAEIDDSDWRIAFQRSFRALHRSLGRGESIVWDFAGLTRAQRDHIRATGERYGHQVSLIYLATTDAERARRWAANRLTGTRIDVPEPDFWQAGQTFEPPGDDEPHIRWDGQGDPAHWIGTTLLPMLSDLEMESQRW